jgi:hypothetical protein
MHKTHHHRRPTGNHNFEQLATTTAFTMKHEYMCAPTVWHEKPLVFTWDDVTGEVSGPDAERILLLSQDSGLVGHPYPTYWEFADGCGDGKHIRSRQTLALIVGQAHALPDDLKPDYPLPQADDRPDVSFTDADGTVVIGRDSIVN